MIESRTVSTLDVNSSSSCIFFSWSWHDPQYKNIEKNVGRAHLPRTRDDGAYFLGFSVKRYSICECLGWLKLFFKELLSRNYKDARIAIHYFLKGKRIIAFYSTAPGAKDKIAADSSPFNAPVERSNAVFRTAMNYQHGTNGAEKNSAKALHYLKDAAKELHPEAFTLLMKSRGAQHSESPEKYESWKEKEKEEILSLVEIYLSTMSCYDPSIDHEELLQLYDVSIRTLDLSYNVLQKEELHILSKKVKRSLEDHLIFRTKTH